MAENESKKRSPRARVVFQILLKRQFVRTKFEAFNEVNNEITIERKKTTKEKRHLPRAATR